MTIRSIKTLAVVVACVIAVGAGCGTSTRNAVGPTTAPSRYVGPTDPLDVVIGKINANNARVETLFAVGTFEMRLVEGEKKHLPIFGDIRVLHVKPNQIRLFAEKDVTRVFDMGTDGERFWLAVYGDVDTAWVGTDRGPTAPPPRGLPIAPGLLVDVLGVATLDPDLMRPPLPTMRFNPDYDAYMLTWHAPAADRWVTTREVWYDRATLEPERIWLFAPDGRVVLRALLSRLTEIEADSEATRGAKVATRYRLLFPESGSTLDLTLDEVRDRRGRVPDARASFRFDPRTAKVRRVENLDEEPATDDPTGN